MRTTNILIGIQIYTYSKDSIACLSPFMAIILLMKPLRSKYPSTNIFQTLLAVHLRKTLNNFLKTFSKREGGAG